MQKELEQVKKIFPEAKICKTFSNRIIFENFDVFFTDGLYELGTEQETGCEMCGMDSYVSHSIAYSEDFSKIEKVLQAIKACDEKKD